MMKMTRSEIVCLLMGLLCVMQITAAPAVNTDAQARNNNALDEIIMRLKELRQQEGHGRSIRIAPPVRPQTHHAYFYPINHGHFDIPKRNFDEIDRLSDFDKRNFDEIDRASAFSDFKKRNFDEIDRMASLNDF